MKAAACGGDQRGLDGELEEKLLLRDGGLTRCSAGAAALLQKRGMIERRRLPPVLAGQGGAGDAGDYHERFVRAYDRLRDELLADDSCELTDEARRWVEQVRGRRHVVVRIRMRAGKISTVHSYARECFSIGASYSYMGCMGFCHVCLELAF
jgi:hypothetical protein